MKTKERKSHKLPDQRSGKKKHPVSASVAAPPGRPPVVSYLGPEATFTHLAALKHFGASVSYRPSSSITEVFLEVERGEADLGVAPIENSIEGAVSQTMDMLVHSHLKIHGEIQLDISHNLLGRGPLGRIKRLYSKSEVFGQCCRWLDAHLPKADCIATSSTTHAARIVARETNAACIASILAANTYKLKVLVRDIEDDPDNITRFLVIGKGDSDPTGSDKTSIVVSINNRIGALYEMLAPFRRYRINLTRIESRPSKRKAWKYFFFLDLLGHATEPKIKKALRALKKKSESLKILGSYPVKK